MASLTKMMTAYTVLNLVDKLGIDMTTELLTIGEEATHVIGTSAELVAGDMLTIEQLMYGMMLPSGNDAAFALAQHFGNLLLPRKEQFDKFHNKILIDSCSEEDSFS